MGVEMKWTTELPTKPGWYWVRYVNDTTIMHVKQADSVGLVVKLFGWAAYEELTDYSFKQLMKVGFAPAEVPK